MGKLLPKILRLWVCLLPGLVFALVPLENLVLGDYEDGQILIDQGPLDYLFTELYEGQMSSTRDQQIQLKKMLGIYLEGENLKNFCAKRVPIRYSNDWEKRLALRSVLTTLQFMSLDVSVRAIGRLTRELEFQLKTSTRILPIG